MTVYPIVSLWILVLTALTLFWVALTDLREFKVRNELVVILACLYVVYALFSGAWVSMQWNFAFALVDACRRDYTPIRFNTSAAATLNC